MILRFSGELHSLGAFDATRECTTSDLSNSTAVNWFLKRAEIILVVFSKSLDRKCLAIQKTLRLTRRRVFLDRIRTTPVSTTLLTMQSLAPRALSVGRQAALYSSSLRPSLLQRASILPIAQTASIAYQSKISYELKPADKDRKWDGTKKTVKKKLSNRSEASKRPFVPPPTKSEEELAALPYIVRRTPYAQLPIYRRFMSGGNRTLILIKRVDGNRKQLVLDLTRDLNLEKDDIRLNPTTQHIEIKVRQGLSVRETAC